MTAVRGTTTLVTVVLLVAAALVTMVAGPTEAVSIAVDTPQRDKAISAVIVAMRQNGETQAEIDQVVEQVGEGQRAIDGRSPLLSRCQSAMR